MNLECGSSVMDDTSEEYILDLEAIAEINAIPGAREHILEGYKSIESGEDDNDLPTWEEFMKEMGLRNEP